MENQGRVLSRISAPNLIELGLIQFAKQVDRTNNNRTRVELKNSIKQWPSSFLHAGVQFNYAAPIL